MAHRSFWHDVQEKKNSQHTQSSDIGIVNLLPVARPRLGLNAPKQPTRYGIGIVRRRVGRGPTRDYLPYMTLRVPPQNSWQQSGRAMATCPKGRDFDLGSPLRVSPRPHGPFRVHGRCPIANKWCLRVPLWANPRRRPWSLGAHSYMRVPPRGQEPKLLALEPAFSPLAGYWAVLPCVFAFLRSCLCSAPQGLAPLSQL